MPIYLRQSTASQEVPLGHFVDDADGKTAETGLTIANTDIKLWASGATTLANKTSGGATHVSGGVYYCVLDATDTATIGPLVIFVAVSGALAVRVECVVLDEAVYDSLFGTTALSTYAGGAVASVTGAVGSIGSGGITSASFAAGAIDNAAIAADAIGSSELASSAVTEIQSGLATSSALSTLDGKADAIKAKTDNLPASPAATGDIPTATQNADALLDRDMGAGADTNARSPRNALRFLRNKWSLSGPTLTVTKEDDATTAWTAAVSTDAAADPVTGSDPA